MKVKGGDAHGSSINNNLITEKEYGNMMLLLVNENFKIDPSLYSKSDKDNVNKTFELFQRIKDTQQAELITTILYSYDQLADENIKVTENALFNFIIEWKKRYHTEAYEYRIRELTKDLTIMKLINVDYSKDNKTDELL